MTFKKWFPLIFLAALTGFFVVGCAGKKLNNDKEKQDELLNDVGGNYVTPDYKNRSEGYDWVAVKVNQLTDSILKISIRSRADLKKPTCTFDATVIRSKGTNVFSGVVEGFGIFFNFGADSLVISGETEQDNPMLGYFCSGGASIAGVYHKLAEPLDTAQIDKVIFRKMLNYDKYFFDIEVYNNTLTIKPDGLETDNRMFEHLIEGTVINAETGDLNNDGYPEVLVYLQSTGSGSYGSVIGYSVNNGKSMSRINFPNVADNPDANKGYMGHDEFAIIENTFNQLFPIYNQDDTNANPTGGMRQIQYKLTEGEEMRQLVVDKIVEY
jgi:hypothetical protein